MTEHPPPSVPVITALSGKRMEDGSMLCSITFLVPEAFAASWCDRLQRWLDDTFPVEEEPAGT